jgi:Cu+-exporting ATPase
VLGFSGHEFFSKGLAAARRLSPDMNTLIALGTGTAFFISALGTLSPELFHSAGAHAPIYFEAAAVIIAFVLIGRLLEERAREKAGESIRKLAGLAARKARIVRNGVEEELPASQVRRGDLLRVLPGEKFPADGVLLEGFTAVDESMVTGESVPAEKKRGDPVIGATLNGNGSVLVKATRVGQETALAQIMKLVREARTTKAPIQRLADRIAAVFVPVVTVIAIATFAVWYFAGPEPRLIRALTAATSVLIVACPCALGLATPAALLVGIGKGAEKGILIRNAEALEKAGHIQAIVFDKTGTLTEGRPEVESVHSAAGRMKEELLAPLVALERHSEHPLARAILKHAEGMKLRSIQIRDATAQPGGGIRGIVDGSPIVAGSAEFVSATGVVIPSEHLEKAGDLTALFAAIGGRYLGAVFFADPIKVGVKAEMDRLSARGLALYLLSGDRPEVAFKLAKEAGIEESNTVAGVKPEGKAAFIDELREKGIQAAMVGDGINDSPALARATVGIAMGTGTEVAMAASDITLVGGSIRGVRKALDLAAATRKILFQNLALAFVYNVLLIPVAAGVLYPFFGITMNPMLAGGAMALSSVSVVTNALRLKRVAI